MMHPILTKALLGVRDLCRYVSKGAYKLARIPVVFPLNQPKVYRSLKETHTYTYIIIKLYNMIQL